MARLQLPRDPYVGRGKSTLASRFARVNLTPPASDATPALPFAVGAIYTNVTGVNPATELGYGTWAAFGEGRVLVGFKAATPPFDVAGAEIGSADHSHLYDDVVNHTHDVPTTSVGIAVLAGTASAQDTNVAADTVLATSNPSGGVAQGETHAADSLPEAIVVYFWKRTA